MRIRSRKTNDHLTCLIPKDEDIASMREILAALEALAVSINNTGNTPGNILLGPARRAIYRAHNDMTAALNAIAAYQARGLPQVQSTKQLDLGVPEDISDDFLWRQGR